MPYISELDRPKSNEQNKIEESQQKEYEELMNYINVNPKISSKNSIKEQTKLSYDDLDKKVESIIEIFPVRRRSSSLTEVNKKVI